MARSEISSPVTDDTLRLARLFWLAIAVAALCAVCAICTARDLVYDGAFYLLATAAHAHLRIIEPARAVVQGLQQCFAVAGERAGITDLFVLSRLLSLGISGWPVVLTALCWPVLPRAEKAWILGPLLNLAAVIPLTGFIGIGEGIIASCLLWLLFLLFAFRLREPWGAAAAILLAIACAFVHEAAFAFMAGLSLAALLRAWRAHGLERLAALCVAMVAGIAALYLLGWTLAPRSAIERSNFLFGLLGSFFGTGREPNLAALASTAAALAVAAMAWTRGRTSWPAWGAALIFVIAAGFMLAMPDRLITPGRYFAARGLPVMFTTAAAAILYIAKERGVSPARFVTRPVAAILLGLILTQAALQLTMTERWWTYTGDLRSLVASRHGVVSFDESSRAINPSGSRFRRELLESWSVEPLSLVLAPHGQVQAWVEAAPFAPWVPYHADKPRSLPRAPGLDWSRFPTAGAPQ
ncbi:MAG TPA: hypothetical protein VGF97_16850 [Rhizomicrobium sp.]|jgi:hypothetical protein